MFVLLQNPLRRDVDAVVDILLDGGSSPRRLGIRSPDRLGPEGCDQPCGFTGFRPSLSQRKAFFPQSSIVWVYPLVNFLGTLVE